MASLKRGQIFSSLTARVNSCPSLFVEGLGFFRELQKYSLEQILAAAGK